MGEGRVGLLAKTSSQRQVVIVELLNQEKHCAKSTAGLGLPEEVMAAPRLLRPSGQRRGPAQEGRLAPLRGAEDLIRAHVESWLSAEWPRRGGAGGRTCRYSNLPVDGAVRRVVRAPH